MIARDARLRVVLPHEPLYPGFARVIWNAHVAEMSDLSESDRAHLMGVLMAVERAQREGLSPDKINLASLGNMVPHLHWHVVPRWRDDSHFPASVWSPLAAGRDATQVQTRIGLTEARLPAYQALLAGRLRSCGLDDGGLGDFR